MSPPHRIVEVASLRAIELSAEQLSGLAPHEHGEAVAAVSSGGGTVTRRQAAERDFAAIVDQRFDVLDGQPGWEHRARDHRCGSSSSMRLLESPDGRSSSIDPFR